MGERTMNYERLYGELKRVIFQHNRFIHDRMEEYKNKPNDMMRAYTEGREYENQELIDVITRYESYERAREAKEERERKDELDIDLEADEYHEDKHGNLHKI